MDAFKGFRDSLQRLGGTVELDSRDVGSIREVAREIQQVQSVSVRSLADLVAGNPEVVRVVGLCAGLSQEQLRNVLKQWFGTSSFRRVATESSRELVERLDESFSVLSKIRRERRRDWTYADIIIERFRSRSRAAGSIERGRGVEDQVEAVVQGLGLPHEMRTRFEGRRGESAPCDLAIPRGGPHAQIVCGIKGFDSTGSKLTDAASEIARMAEVRTPRQYVFALVDGIGWLSRQADLRRIFELHETNAIDGLFTLSHLSEFEAELRAAARRIGLSE